MAAASIQRETWAGCSGELLPLFARHFAEIAAHQDLPLDVDAETYALLEQTGHLRVFTVRTDGWQLVGYAIYVVRAALHRRGCIQAEDTLLWLAPEHRRRGLGSQLLEHVATALRAEGVAMLIQRSSARHPIAGVLTRLGYRIAETTHVRRLDRET